MSKVYVLLNDKQSGNPITFYNHDINLFKEYNSKGYGVYKAVNEFEATQEQMDAIKAKTIRHEQFLSKFIAVYADLDIAKHGDNAPDQVKKELKENLLAQLEIKHVSFVVETANGLQPQWVLKDTEINPRNIARYKNIIDHINKWSIQHGCKGDDVKDVTRVLRMEGYYHNKGEPFMCDVVFEQDTSFTLDEMEKLFDVEFIEEKPKLFESVKVSPIFSEIDKLDIKDVATEAFRYMNRTCEFDNQGRLILDGRLTGTFQGKKGDQQFLASNSHEPYTGNRITLVSDICNMTTKDAHKWLCDTFKINYKEARAKQKAQEIIEDKPKEIKPEYKLRYTWGTDSLDDNFAIIKRNSFIVIGAKRNSGKTTYSFDMAIKNARKGHKTLYLSLEMDSEDMFDMFARKSAGITVKEEYSYTIPEYKQKRYEDKLSDLKNTPNLEVKNIGIHRSLTWESIEEIINLTQDVDMVFIDNLDLISSEDRQTEIEKQKHIVKRIKALTLDKNIPVVLIHHYRKSGKEDHGMDEMSGSGKIADTADYVIKVTRNTDQEAVYPEKYETILFLQKARGYFECIKSIYYQAGSFVDSLPTIANGGWEVRRDLQ